MKTENKWEIIQRGRNMDKKEIQKKQKVRCIYPTPLLQAGCDTRSILKQSRTGLNSDFSFLTSCLTKTQESSLPYYLLIAEESRKIHAFLKGISTKWKANNLVQDLNSCHCVHFLSTSLLQEWDLEEETGWWWDLEGETGVVRSRGRNRVVVRSRGRNRVVVRSRGRNRVVVRSRGRNRVVVRSRGRNRVVVRSRGRNRVVVRSRGRNRVVVRSRGRNRVVVRSRGRNRVVVRSRGRNRVVVRSRGRNRVVVRSRGRNRVVVRCRRTNEETKRGM